MKKTLAAMAVLSAFAGSAFAADVTVYGVVDLGLNYQHQKVGDADATDKLTQYSGQNSGSRFGLKGTEDLGNGYKVGFNLENSFKADDGAFDKLPPFPPRIHPVRSDAVRRTLRRPHGRS